jgi:phosphotransferase system IIB component
MEILAAATGRWRKGWILNPPTCQTRLRFEINPPSIITAE